MPFDYTTAKVMTRSYSVLLAEKTELEIQAALEQHAVPRIRLFLLTATDGTGNHVLYSNLTDLGDAATAAAAELVVDSIIDESTCSIAIRRIASALAASWLILSDLSVLDSQQKAAATLEKQAMIDLDKLAKSPLLKSAAIGATSSVLAAERAKPPAVLYLALDADENTADVDNFVVSPYAGAQLPYVGAPDAGRAKIIVNGVTIGPVTVAEDDTPVTVAYRLVEALESMGNTRPNFNLMVTERGNWKGTRVLPYTDPLTGLPVTGPFNLTTVGAQLAIVPRNYEATIDVIVATFILERRIELAPTTYEPGVLGFGYGINSTLSQLTTLGPHAVAVDLEQGKATVLGSSSSTTTIPISDSFFFVCDTLSGVTQADGLLKYQVNSLTERTVTVPAGSDATALASLLAQDMGSVVSTQKVLGATRPSAKVTVNGTPVDAPSLEIVAIGIESQTAVYVVKVKQVPTGIIFGVQAQGQAPANFDAREKTVVVTPVINKPRLTDSSATSGVTPLDPGTGGALLPVYVPSPALAKILKNWGKPR